MKALIITDFHRGINHNTSQKHDAVYPFIDQSLFDCVLVSGDWGSSDLNHVDRAFKYLRKIFPDKPIFGVLGNHDFWNKRPFTAQEKYKFIFSYAKNHNVILLENNKNEFMGYTLLGYNGWFDLYDTERAEARTWLANPRDLLLFKQNENKAMDYIIQQNTHNRNKTIIMSHFPVYQESFDGIYDNGNPNFRSIISQKARFFIFGHTHNFFYQELDNTLVINVGAEYNEVHFSIYDFDNETFIHHHSLIK